MSKPKVYVTRRIPDPGLEMLKEKCDVTMNPEDRPLTYEELKANIKGMDGVLCLLTDKIDGELMDSAPEVKGYAQYAVGYNNIDVPAATERGKMISNTPGVLTDATAEMAWSLLFSAGRRVVESDQFMRSGKWEGWGPMQFIGQDVTNATLGVVGSGRIGTAMALKSKGFNMKVLYTDKFDSKVLEDELGARKVSMDELLAESDFISIHVPYMESTHHLFSKEEFVKMKKTAVLINTARGPIVDEAALKAALEAGEIAAAGIDVFENEPKCVPGLEKRDNVVMTPHTASATWSSRNGMSTKAAANLLAMVTGETPPDCVNPEVLK